MNVSSPNPVSLLEPSAANISTEVAVIGGGPAGLSAGIWLARYLHDVILIDSGDPRNWETTGVNGYLGLPSIRPPELRARGREEFARYEHTRLLDDCVSTISARPNKEFQLSLMSGTCLTAKRVLLAYGLRDIWPDIDGLERVYGADAHVCPDCDGYIARDSRIAVIGKRRRAVGMALNLTTWTRDISIFTNGEDPDIDADLLAKLEGLKIPVVTSKISSMRIQDGDLRALEFADGTPPFSCAHIFFTIGQYLADDLGNQLGCERDDDGHLVVDRSYCTSVEHVWAAGDIVPGAQLAIAAAADGAIAAMSIHKSLIPSERRLS